MNQVQEDSFNTFERCPHDRVNPYAQINRDLIRDKTLSPRCRWFLIYCLSYDDKWKISIPYFIREQDISQEIMYKILNEAIEAGYILRQDYLQGGLKRFRYFISEFPKFKKILPCPEKPDTEKPDTEKSGTTKEQSSTNKQYKKAPPASGSPPKGRKKSASPPSADAESCVEFFIKSLKERTPDMEMPNKENWAREIDVMISKGRSPEHIKTIIDWASKTQWYKSNVLSPTSLRKYFDKMWLNMKESNERREKEEIVTKNKEYCLEMQEKYPIPLEKLVIRGGYAINNANSKEVPLNLPHDQFKTTLIHIFGGRTK